jgi:pyruvate dehydrogenase E2 component (dihydrolipoamide acetyltransferase)
MSVDAEMLGARRVAIEALGGDGPDALLLHGFGADRLSWLANETAIGAVAKLYALDLPGHGASGMDVGDGALETLSRRIAEALDRKGLHRLHLIGHSLGGGLALMLAASRPDLVASLALIAPAGLGTVVDQAFLSEFPALSRAEETQALLRRLVVRPRLIGKPLIDLVLAQLARPGARSALTSIAEGIARVDYALNAAADRIAQSDLPRLVIWGEEDAINPLSSAKLAAFGGRALIVADAGHLPHVESPRRVNEAIVDFLTRQGGG